MNTLENITNFETIMLIDIRDCILFSRADSYLGAHSYLGAKSYFGRVIFGGGGGGVEFNFNI